MQIVADRLYELENIPMLWVVRGDDRRSWGILAGRTETPSLWILPAAWKTRLSAHQESTGQNAAFPTPLWTARAPPTGSTGVRILDKQMGSE